MLSDRIVSDDDQVHATFRHKFLAGYYSFILVAYEDEISFDAELRVGDEKDIHPGQFHWKFRKFNSDHFKDTRVTDEKIAWKLLPYVLALLRDFNSFLVTEDAPARIEFFEKSIVFDDERDFVVENTEWLRSQRG